MAGCENNLVKQQLNTPEEKKNQETADESNVQSSDTDMSSFLVFPAAPLLLECAKDEYTKERERTQFLDNKASFFMSAIILIATIFIPFIPFDKVRGGLISGTEEQKAAIYVFGTLVLVSLIVLVLAFKNLYDAYKIKGYARFNIENIVDFGILTQDKNVMEKALCDNYKNTIEKNIMNNDDKAVKISDGIAKCAIGFLLLAISAIVIKIFIG